MKTNRETLIKVYDQTVEACKVGGYRTESGDWVDLPVPGKKSYFYSTVPQALTSHCPRPYDESVVYVQNIDCLQKAKELGPDCAVLNMASFIKPGGGVRNGSMAQEEELFRRTNLSRALYRFYGSESETYDIQASRFQYPIPKFGGIYTPKITVFRHALSYSFLERPFQCSVISVAAIKNPEKDKNGLMTEEAITITKGKIRAILRIALINGHGKLVLSALGCGAYKNNPTQVAQAFKDVLGEPEFKGAFSEICFAILEDKNSLKNQEGGNLRPFQKIFEQ